MTITGTNFTGRHGGEVRRHRCDGLHGQSATSITATSPAGTGTVDVTVTTTGGTSATSAADQFTYVARADRHLDLADRGPTAGGTSVTITGTNFTGATAVKFGAHRGDGLHRQFARPRSPRPRRRAPARWTYGDDRRAGPRRPRRPISSPMSAAPTVTSISPTVGTGSRRHVGDDHRHQFHRRHGGEVRRHRRDRLHRQFGHLDHRDIAGRYRHGGRHGDDRGRDLGDVGGRSVHLRRGADGDVDRADLGAGAPAARR